MPKMTIMQLVADIDGDMGNDEPTHFERGVETAKDMEYVTIALNNVWGGRSKDGGSVSSYEKIGYHAGSVSFIEGVLSTGCPVIVFRHRNNDLRTFDLYDEFEEHKVAQSWTNATT